ncbi:hypothetical protein [Agrobacterium genomosp. 13]|uniref:Uncharacterized protein n=1 Tax=Agrobacterium genomosp. 13 str. CFBP 6927 TaxID=1183428 RepID=A0ABM9VG10_9HYPH|nr:hypothetical protein [Agrobacterium genomosp. 13]CUX31800.1 conserved hypothetical protein [Agrobacterium genomosp. 13 str. CFBP 6927]
MASKSTNPTIECDGQSLISLEAAGKLLGLSAERIRLLVKDGFIERPAPGRVTLGSVARGYARYWQEKASQQTKTSEDQRVKRARAEEIEQRIAERNRRLVPAEEAIAAIDHIVGACVETFNALPAMITRDIAERKRIETVVRNAQHGVARRLGEAADLVRKGGTLPGSE